MGTTDKIIKLPWALRVNPLTPELMYSRLVRNNGMVGKVHAERYSYRVIFGAVPNFYFFCPSSGSYVVKNMCIYTYLIA